ncbi:Uncharacterised protein [Sphingobacterium multivorum]|uniref:Uncharacterized protein n=1 Tax=Sphingobacterium multivorum TaxID=28454 RepID=A0A2X2ITR2_SPHMU|nr:Uncharacterised protein [Sphingobacterium multivorum]
MIIENKPDYQNYFKTIVNIIIYHLIVLVFSRGKASVDGIFNLKLVIEL